MPDAKPMDLVWCVIYSVGVLLAYNTADFIVFCLTDEYTIFDRIAYAFGFRRKWRPPLF